MDGKILGCDYRSGTQLRACFGLLLQLLEKQLRFILFFRGRLVR